MTNTPETVQFALQQGANGLEMDLQFDVNGKATVFQHGGGSTDCLCVTYGVCTVYHGDSATRSTDAAQHLLNVASKPGIALVVVDSKIAGTAARQNAAGKAAVKLLEDQLFGKGYAGQVVISTGSLSATTYLGAVATAAMASMYKNRIHFTFDEEGSGAAQTLTALAGFSNPNRVYGTGISACLPTQYYDAIALAVKNRKAGVAGLVYTWTIDKTSTMDRYVALGVDGIITNDPAALKGFVVGKGISLAAPSAAIPAATNQSVITQ